MFDIKGPTFEFQTIHFLELFSDYADEVYAVWHDRISSMAVLKEDSRVFKHHPNARYVYAVTFQQRNRTSWRIRESKIFQWEAVPLWIHG